MALLPTEGGHAPPQHHLKVHGFFHHVEERHNTCDACLAAIIYYDNINKSVLD
jgi:hypothetical protein